MHSSIKIFLYFALLVLCFNPKNICPLLLLSSSENKLFELRTLPQGYLTFLGDSHLRHSDIALTKEGPSTNAPGSAGVVLYKKPILLIDPRSKHVSSFYTMFAFCIQSIYEDEEAFGDGLAFLISANDYVLGSPKYFGLVNSTDVNRNKFIAIEFDTKRDSIFHDPDDNHVGLDINSLSSVKVATSSSLGVNLKSGVTITTWIDYRSNEKRLEVFLSHSYLKPKRPLLKVDIDLFDYLKENMFVGFSASSEGSMQLTRIQQWEFTIVGFSPPPPHPSPPFPPELEKTNPSPSESRNKHGHLSWFAVGLIVGICSVPFLVLLRWFCWKKLMEMIQKSEGTNNSEMQTIRSSGGTCHENKHYILVDEVARGLTIQKVLDHDVELIPEKTLKSSIPLSSSLPAVKPSNLPLCNGLPARLNDITSA